MLVQSASPHHAVGCKVLPGLGVDVKCFHVSLADILVPQLWAVFASPSRCQLSIENVFWDTATVQNQFRTKLTFDIFFSFFFLFFFFLRCFCFLLLLFFILLVILLNVILFFIHFFVDHDRVQNFVRALRCIS